MQIIGFTLVLFKTLISGQYTALIVTTETVNIFEMNKMS